MSSPDLIVLQVVEVDPAEEKRIIQDIHSYASKGSPGAEPEASTRPAATKNPVTKPSKRRTPRSCVEDLPLIEVQNNIIQALAEKINERSDQLEKMIQGNSDDIELMKVALDSVRRHVLDLKEDNDKLKTENIHLRQKMSESQANKQETFHLRLHGVAENSSEDVVEKVRELCSALVPEKKRSAVSAAVESAHRVGEGGESRPIIISFTSRAARDLTWKHAEQSIFLQNQGFSFKEDLTVREEAAGSGLWSAVEKMRREDLLNHSDCEEKVPDDQEQIFSLDQEEPEPPQIQVKVEGLSWSQEAGQLVLNQEADPLTVTPADEEDRKPEPNGNQLLLQNRPAAEKPGQDGNRLEDVKAACGRKCLDQDNLSVHMRDRGGDKQNLCLICGKRLKSVSSLNQHKMIHSGEKPYICEHCGKGFRAKHSLLIHMRIHTGERPFSCETCGKTFVRRENLTIHKTIHSDKRSYSCEFCGKTFKRVDVLGFHRRIHTGEKVYSCELCGKKFTQGSALRVHRRIHRGEIPRRDVHQGKNLYPCKVCGKRFTQKAYVSIHTRIHTGENLYPCDICGKRFSQKDYVLIHMRSHTGEKPYSCQTCGSRFAQKGSLTRHMDTHGSMVRYSCKTCGEGFGHRGSLNLHLRSHKDEKSFHQNSVAIDSHENTQMGSSENVGESKLSEQSSEKH